MNKVKQDLQSEMEKSAALLRTLRDEVRLQVHLGGSELKSEWHRLEPRIESVLDRAAKDVSGATRTAVAEITETIRTLRESLL